MKQRSSGSTGLLGLPLALLLVAVLVVPLAWTFSSLASRDGLAHLIRLTNDLALWVALANSLLYAIVGGLAVTVLSLLSAWAMWVAFGHRARRVCDVLLLPGVLGPVVAGYVISGLVSWLNAGGLLADPVWARLIILGINVWLGLGVGTLLCLSAIRTMDQRTVEAVRLDGGGTWAVVVHAVRPALAPTLGTIFLLTAIAGLQVFELPLLLFAGPGPGGAGLTLTMYLYGLAFGQAAFGPAAWVALLQGLFVVVLSSRLPSGRPLDAGGGGGGGGGEGG